MKASGLKFLVLVMVILSLPLALVAQTGTISGKVTDTKTSEGLYGANVSLVGTTMGAAVDQNSAFKIFNVPVGTYQVQASFIGYTTAVKEIVVVTGETAAINFTLASEVLFGQEIAIFADRAKERETPVAFSNIKKSEMQARLASQDIPMVLNTTPSVYATMQGGGAGDARINIRGFDQRNVAIMLNGVPINDMENGWVYWSNWDGVGDATSSIQIQRGLTAVNLATPAIGGAMNIITDPTQTKAGVNMKTEVGSGDFKKTTFSFGSGLINNKFAVNGNIVRKTGVGVVDATWTDAWAYYLGAALQLNPKNRVELYAIGAPQRHGQNLYKQNIGAYDHGFAKDIEYYDEEALEKYSESDAGRLYNETWNSVSTSYYGKQYFNGTTHNRYSPYFINERENFYHKPIVNLNWYSTLNEEMNLFTTVYYSGGNGGGSGTYGKLKYDYSGPSRVVDWDATIAKNDTSSTGSFGILRNSANNQWTIGTISKLNYKPTEELEINVGLDWRTAKIFHFREVRDLLGGDYYRYTGDDFDVTEADYQKGLGDKIAYNFTNTVDWLGGFAQGEYTTGKVTAYGTAGVSGIKYTHKNHFTKTSAGNKLEVETDVILGYQVKGGASYRFTSELDAFVNAGYVSKVPVFDGVIDDGDGTKADEPQNETFINFEGGLNYTQPMFNVKLNGYYTMWNDRTKSRGYTNPEGREVLVFLSGLDAIHMGVELEAGVRPCKALNVSAVAGIGNWKYTDDVSGKVKDYDTDTFENYNYYVKDLKVGDMPQTILGLGLDFYPVEGMYLRAEGRYYADHYAAFDPFDRTKEDDRTQSWKAPSYSLIDLHGYYTLPFDVSGLNVKIFAHVLNLLDEVYVQDAVDNSSYNGFDKNHTADDAEVYLGLPRTFNIGIEVAY